MPVRKIPSNPWSRPDCKRLERAVAETLESRVLLSAPIFQAQQTFATGAGSHPVSGATADLTADGKLDLIVVNKATSSVGVLLGNGDGTFKTEVTFATGGTSPRSVGVADVNGDGEPDLIVVNGGSTNVGVLLGNGTGTFQAATTFAVGSVPNSVAVADVDGDGKPDIVTANYSGHDVSVLLGNGNGTFQTQNTFSTGATSEPFTVALADLNGDGKPDLIVDSKGTNAIRILLGNGNGAFQTQQTFAATGFAFAVADVNGDSKPDLIESNNTNNAVGVMLGNGNGTFQVQETFATNGSPPSIAVADVNGDGKQDLIVANYGNSAVGVLLGNGNGTFAAQQTLAAGSNATAVVVADVNDDGRSDIIVANLNGNSVSVLLGDPPPIVESIARTTPAGPAIAATSVTYTVTFNKPVTGVALSNFSLALSGVTTTPPLVLSGSGAVYTVTINGISGAGTLGLNLVNNGTIHDSLNQTLGPAGNFPTQQTFASGAGGQSTPYSVVTADVNGDGIPDVIVPGSKTGSIAVLLGNGNGTFQAPQTFSVTGVWRIAVADVNGDGKLDVIAADFNAADMGVLLGNGNGTFQPQQTFDAGVRSNSVATADLTDDGRQDLIATDFFLATVSVMLSNGNGTFQAPATLATGSSPDSVAAADLNGDGKPDLVVANQGSGGSVSVLLGNGNGTFQAQKVFAIGGAPETVAVADVNGDGIPDLIVANQTSRYVSVLLGNGNGTFQPQATFAVGPGASSVAVADVNRDGNPDLVVVNFASNSVSELLGNGNGTFQAQLSISTGAGSFPEAVAVADVNGDGQDDLVVANVYSNVNVLLSDPSGNATGQTYTIGEAVSATVTGAATAVPGQPTTFTIVISNDGAFAATGVGVGDTIPANLLGSSFTATDNGMGATGYTASGSGDIADTVSLPVGAKITYTLNGTVSSAATGTLTDTATAATASGIANAESNVNTTTNQGSAGVSLTPVADIYVAISGSDPLIIGGKDVFTIVVTDNGPSDVTGATLADTFSNLSGVSYFSTALYRVNNGNIVRSTPTASTVSGTLTGTGPTLSETLNMSAGSILLFTVTGTVAAGAPSTLTNTVTVADPAGTTDPNTADNSSAVSAAVAASGGSVVGRSIFYADSAFDSSTTGNAQSGSIASTIVLATGASSINGTYVGSRVYLNSGTGAGQYAFITAYAGATRTATISPTWNTVPDTTTAYEVTNTGADTAVATDKVALMPGQNATYSNVSNFASGNASNPASGIDGIFIDISGVPVPATVTAADFEFNIGNSSTPGTGSSPGSGWAALGTAPTVTLFAGAGVGGSSRYALSWPVNTIVKKWLQVTVRGNTSPSPDLITGLAAPDVFYFGSAPGESGNSTTDFNVNATDEIDARNDPHNFLNPAPITDPNDFGRDKNVNATDEILARNNPTNFINALKLIGAPGLPNNNGVASSLATSIIVPALAATSTPIADEKLKADRIEIVVVALAGKNKTAGKSLVGYHVSLGIGIPVGGYRFGDKLIA